MLFAAAAAAASAEARAAAREAEKASLLLLLVLTMLLNVTLFVVDVAGLLLPVEAPKLGAEAKPLALRGELELAPKAKLDWVAAVVPNPAPAVWLTPKAVLAGRLLLAAAEGSGLTAGAGRGSGLTAGPLRGWPLMQSVAAARCSNAAE